MSEHNTERILVVSWRPATIETELPTGLFVPASTPSPMIGRSLRPLLSNPEKFSRAITLSTSGIARFLV